MKYKILFLAMSVALFSCGTGDSPPSEPSIYKKWYYKEVVKDGLVIPYTDHESCGKDYIQFYDVDKVRNVDIWDCEADYDWEGTFILEGDELTLFNGSTSRSVLITTLSFDDLIFEYFADTDDDGIEEHFVEKYTAY